MKIAIVFGFAGSNGEADLLEIITKLCGKPTNLSRCSLVETGECATRQVLSFDLEGTISTQMLNAALPDDIRVYDVIQVPGDFSARRSCSARTFEYLIPSYAFKAPPSESYYCYDPISELPLDDSDRQSLFHTLSRSMSRKKPLDIHDIPMDDLTAPSTPLPEPKGCLSFFKMIWKTLNKMRGSESLKTALDGTLRRQTQPTNVVEPTIVETLRRSLSRKKSQKEWKNEEPAHDVVLCDPLELNEPDEEETLQLKMYRINETQMSAIKSILGLFCGTHNFHNYVPGASATDPRCFLRVLNMQVCPPEMHRGTEWIRIKVQSKSFGRFQIRKMMAMIIMVVRCNVPRSIVNVSFGATPIDIPEAPAFSLMLDEQEYDDLEFGSIAPLAQEFRQDVIYESIFTQEVGLVFDTWLRSLDAYSFLYTYWLNPEGVIKKVSHYIRSQDEDDETTKVDGV